MKKSILFAAALTTTGCVLAPLPAEAFGLGGLIQTVIGVPTQPQVRRVEPVQPRVAPSKPRSGLEIGEGGSLEVMGDMNMTTHNTTVNGVTETDQSLDLSPVSEVIEADSSDVKSILENLQWPNKAKGETIFSASTVGQVLLFVQLKGDANSVMKKVKSALQQQGYQEKPIHTRSTGGAFNLVMKGPGPGHLSVQGGMTNPETTHVSVGFASL